MRVQEVVLLKDQKLLQHKETKDYEKPLWFKEGGSVEFWQNLLNEVFKDDARKKIFWIGRIEFFDSAQELKYFIALNILGPNYRDLSAEMKLSVYRL